MSTYKVYIVITQTNTMFSRLLKRITKEPYNHSSISFDSQLNIMYSFARRKIHQPWVAGFIQETPHGGMYKRKPNTMCCVYEMDVNQTQYQEMLRSLGEFLIDSPKYRYNFLGLPFMWVGIPMERSHHYVCSQFVARILDDGGVLDITYHRQLMRPYDFSKLNNIQLIYQGKLKDYSFPSKKVGTSDDSIKKVQEDPHFKTLSV